MKKNYVKPNAIVVEFKQECLQTSGPTVQSNVFLGSGGKDSGASPTIRSRQASFTGGDWEE